GDGGPAKDAQFALPTDLEIGPDGRLYVADTDNHRIRAIDLTTGVVTTVAGSGSGDAGAFAGDGGPATAAQLNRPFGIGFDGAGAQGGDELAALEPDLYLPIDTVTGPDGLLYIIDWNNHRVRQRRADGTLKIVAGGGELADKPSDTDVSRLNHPTDVRFGPDG